MNLNELFSEISSFWSKIFPLILLHILAYGIFQYVFGKRDLQGRIQTFTSSSYYNIFKNNMEKFELWKKLPIILAVGMFIYLAILNTAIDASVQLPIPFYVVSYSESELIEDMYNYPGIAEVGSYQKDSIVNVEQLRVMKDEFMQLYKTKYPEEYRSLINWLNEDFGKSQTNLLLTAILVAGLLYCLGRFRSKHKAGLFLLRTVLIVVCLAYASVNFRFAAEQKIEERITNEFFFVSNHLKNDTTFTPFWKGEELEFKMLHYYSRIENIQDRTTGFWLSRRVEDSWLKYLVGRRKIQSSMYRTTYRNEIERRLEEMGYFEPDTLGMHEKPHNDTILDNGR